MTKRKAPRQPRKASKYDERIHVPGTPEEIATSFFHGRPKPRSEWRFIKADKKRKG